MDVICVFPVSRCFHLPQKLAVALFLGVVLGGVMPSLMAWIGQTRSIFPSEIIGTIPPFLTVVFCFPL